MSRQSTPSRPSIGSVIVVLGSSVLLLTAMAPVGSATHASTELVPDPVAQGDGFGQVLAKSGDTLLVSAPFTDDGEEDQGRAYLFTREDGAWQQAASLQASDPSEGALFGWSLAVDGDTILVGAPRADGEAVNEGAGYVFTHSGEDVVQQARLVASDAQTDDRFGRAVALDQDTAVVSAPMEEGTGWDRGAAYVFTRSDGNWTEQAKIVADDASDRALFGSALALEGDTLLAGAPRVDGASTDEGAVYAFTRSGDNWTQQARLVPEDAGEGDRFGQTLALDGDRLVVGAPFADGPGRHQGAVYVFEASGGWTQQAQLVSSQPEDGALFGSSLALEGSTLAVGAPQEAEGGDERGIAYRLVRENGSWTTATPVAPATSEDRERFGSSLALDGDATIAGAYGRGVGGAVLTITDSRPSAAFDVSPAEPVAGEPVTFSDRSIDEEPLSQHTWDFGDGNRSDQADATHAFPAGTHEVCLTVEDEAGHADQACRTLTVRNKSAGSSPSDDDGSSDPSEDLDENTTDPSEASASSVHAAFEVHPRTPEPGAGVTFQDRSRAPNGSIAAYEWDFGDGARSSEPSPSHAFAANGTYEVCLTVQDPEGRSSTACQPVEVGGAQASAVPAPGGVALLATLLGATLLSARIQCDNESNSSPGPEAKDK